MEHDFTELKATFDSGNEQNSFVRIISLDSYVNFIDRAAFVLRLALKKCRISANINSSILTRFSIKHDPAEIHAQFSTYCFHFYIGCGVFFNSVLPNQTLCHLTYYNILSFYCILYHLNTTVKLKQQDLGEEDKRLR